MPAVPLPPSSYSIRRFQPGDAEAIRQLVTRIYGGSYIHQELYHPDRLVRLNETGQLVSIVAVGPEEQVVGHYAIERPDMGPIGEGGEAMISPDHQHHHLMERMHTVIVEQGQRLDLAGLYGNAVTNHIFTQKMYEHTTGRPCGVSLGTTPKTFHNITEPLPQRMSCLLYFQFLRMPAGVVAHAPRHHQPTIARIYEQFSLQAEFGDPVAPAGTGQVTINFIPERQSGVIRVGRAGAETASAIEEARQDLCQNAGAEVVFLELPLSQPATPHLCRAAEEEGFFFSGIGPFFAGDGDALRLQFLNVKLDTNLLQIENAFARELLDYIAAERQRVGKRQG